mgnify:CR=1 FL=1
MDETCTICLNNVNMLPNTNNIPEENNVVELKCFKTHLFHYDCLKEWLMESDLCPICNTKIDIKQGYFIKNIKKESLSSVI